MSDSKAWGVPSVTEVPGVSDRVGWQRGERVDDSGEVLAAAKTW